MNLLTEMVQAMIYGFIKVPLQAHHRILIFEKMDVTCQSDSKTVLNSELPIRQLNNLKKLHRRPMLKTRISNTMSTLNKANLVRQTRPLVSKSVSSHQDDLWSIPGKAPRNKSVHKDELATS